MPRIEVNTQEEIYMGPITPDVYDGRCLGVEVRPKKSDESVLMLMWTFGLAFEGKDVTVSRFTMLAGKGVGFTREMLTSLQIPYADGDDSLEFDTDDTIGILCTLDIRNEADEQGQTRNVVSSVSRVDE